MSTVDLLAAVVGLVWNVAVLVLLLRRGKGYGLFIVVTFALVSLYTADRVLPRVLVDGWPNMDATGSPALRPIITLPDLVLVGVLAWVRPPRPSKPALLLAAPLLAAGLIGLISGAAHPQVPLSAAIFWCLVPVRAVLVILLVDATISKVGRDSTAGQVLSAGAIGAGLLAFEVIGVVILKAGAQAVGLDLATVWSGFDWERPNLPGWNNNLAASAIGLGASMVVLAPRRIFLPSFVKVGIVALAITAVLLAEYRTAIIVLIAAIAIRGGIEIHARLRPSVGAAALAPSVIGAAILGVAMLGLTAAAVPRLADLNLIGYVTGGLQDGDSPTAPDVVDPGVDEADTSSSSRAQILRAALTVWMRAPLTGPGLGAWEFDRPIEPSFLQRQITPHNGYAWALADLGIIGVTAIFVLPAIMIALRWPPFPLFALALLLAVLEISIVGIAHSRYAVIFWSLMAMLAIPTWRSPTDQHHDLLS